MGFGSGFEVWGFPLRGRVEGLWKRLTLNGLDLSFKGLLGVRVKGLCGVRIEGFGILGPRGWLERRTVEKITVQDILLLPWVWSLGFGVWGLGFRC